MPDIRQMYVAPAVDQTAFNCPHCGALAKQFWYSAHADRLDKDSKPFLVTDESISDFDFNQIEDRDRREKLRGQLTKMATGRPSFESDSKYRDSNVGNVFFSRCFNCDEIAIWLYDRLLWPQAIDAPVANADLPTDVRRDYEEAGSILNQSPRGAAALLRLCIQKLCEVLGEAGQNINQDIASLVRKGLHVQVQQALDVVRVIGNSAVHPGQLDLRDDRATAERLFGLTNLIAEIMISQPKHVRAMFDTLPEDAKSAIARRDKEGKQPV